MRLIYTKDGFNKNEKEEWRVIIFNNILDGLRMTIDAMEEFGISFEYESTTVRTQSSAPISLSPHLCDLC
jgi:guanine nucleotide-binding protein subunit alpha